MRFTSRLPALTVLCVTLAMLGLVAVPAPAPAPAATNQESIIQDDSALDSNPAGTLAKMRLLGADRVRVTVYWNTIAPRPDSYRRPSGFRAADPASYPQVNWTIYDTIVKDARQDGIAVDFALTGPAPLWATGRGAPARGVAEWKPSSSEYGSFVRAIATRYSGSYVPPGASSALPRVSFWTIWNEPNFGEDLAPQAIRGSTVSVGPGMYRGLLDAAWSAFQGTGHGHDTILIGETSARGLSGRASRRAPQGYPGNFAQTKPLQFIRTLYCVDSAYRELRGAPAGARACPTTAAASRRFRAANPGLFHASGFGIHPYPQNLPPTEESSKDPDYVAFSELPRLGRELDRLQGVYGSHTRFPIYNDEYGYITNPPNHGRYVSPPTAAYYINWAEYLSWRNPRIKTTMQYLLRDPHPTGGNDFASGLEFVNGKPKPSYYSYRLPLYLPVTSAKRGNRLEVWGCARPAHFATLDTGKLQHVQIQFRRGSAGAFQTISTIAIRNFRGYFDLRVRFPASGTVRLAYTYPASNSLPPAAANPLLPAYEAMTYYSRYVGVKVR